MRTSLSLCRHIYRYDTEESSTISDKKLRKEELYIYTFNYTLPLDI